MKIYIIIVFLSILFSACGASRIADVTSLRVGMTPDDVSEILGRPVRILSTNYSSDGVQEVYEYINYKNEAYAIEFWNNGLFGYDFMYLVEPPRVVTPAYPVYYPPLQPVQPLPGRPGNVPAPGRPASSGRPGNNGSVSGRPAPSGTTRPTPNKESGRPSRSENTNTVRPTPNNNSESNPSVSGGRKNTNSGTTDSSRTSSPSSGRSR